MHLNIAQNVSKKRKKRRILLAFLALTGLLMLWQYELLLYGIGQASGQLRILYQAKPVSEILQDAQFPDSLKQKLLLIQEIKKYAEDSLGLKPSDNYTTVYDQKGKAVLWNVTACEPYALKAKEWSFPLLGSFSYKGFFDYEKAQKEEAGLKTQGYDTDISEVGGWSTLGFFRDPVLSNMLLRKEGSLANLIIHELTHGTLYVKNNVEYNENLASFVGDEGALRFLRYKYGQDAPQVQHYQQSKSDQEHFSAFVLKAARSLDSLYQGMAAENQEAVKKQKKQAQLQHIVNSLDTVQFFNPRYKKYFENEFPNNTFFMGYIRYREKQNYFRDQFYREFKGNFPAYMAYLKKTYPSL